MELINSADPGGIMVWLANNWELINGAILALCVIARLIAQFTDGKEDDIKVEESTGKVKRIIKKLTPVIVSYDTANKSVGKNGLLSKKKKKKTIKQ